MAGFDSSSADSDYGFSGPHLIGLLCLGGGVALIIGLSTGSQPEPTPKRNVQPLVATSSAVANADHSAEDSSPVQIHSVAKPAIPHSPAIAERPTERRPVWPQGIFEKILSAAVAERVPAEFAFQPNWDRAWEHELEAELRCRVPDVGLSYLQASNLLRTLPESQRFNSSRRSGLIQSTSEKEQETEGPIKEVLALLGQSKVNGFPLQMGDGCKRPEKEAAALEKVSRDLHSEISRIESGATSAEILLRRAQARSRQVDDGIDYPTRSRPALLVEAMEYKEGWHKSEAMPALMQILEVEGEPVRDKLVMMLQKQNAPEITKPLLHRAIFDLSYEVRHTANRALQNRPVKEYRGDLLAALRYPWAPVAWHAAETLAMVNDQSVVPVLIELLNAPDPAAPFRDKSGKMKVRELVKVNHLRNCLLCHAQSHSPADLVAAPIPTPGRPLPQIYYNSRRSSGSVFVRADVTYLRQDFSLLEDVDRQGPWPERQRFDYFVRTRDAHPEEIKIHDMKSAQEKRNYPQRSAVLAALQSLTRKNFGPDAETWRRGLTP